MENIKINFDEKSICHECNKKGAFVITEKTTAWDAVCLCSECTDELFKTINSIKGPSSK